MKRLVLIAGVLVGFAIVAALSFGIAWRVRRNSSSDPQAAALHAQRGTAYLQQHLYKAAIAEFEAATRKSPRALDPWVGLAAVYIRLGDSQKAIEDAGKAASIARNSSEVQIVLARAHWLAGNLSEAEKAALKARELVPSSLAADELLLNIYLQRHEDAKFQDAFDSIETPSRAINSLAVQFALRHDQFRKAYDLQARSDLRDLETETLRYQLALKRDPSQTDLYPALIKNLVRFGRGAEAIAMRRAYTGNAPLDLEMAEANWLEGNRAEAVRAFESASAGKRHKLPAEIALAAITGDRRHWLEAFRSENPEKDYFVLARLEDLLKTAPPLEKAFIYRYAGLFDAELFNRCAEQAITVLKGEPDNFEALMTLATAYSRLGRLDDALRYAQQGTEHHPDRAEVWSRVGQLTLSKGDPVAATPFMEKAVRLEPSNASYLYNYGWLLDQLDRDQEAASFYERAIAASSLSFEAMNNLALLESAAGHGDRAVALLNSAVNSNPGNDAAYMNRANYYFGERSWQNALADYARAAELNPLNPYASMESGRTHLELNRADIAIEELNDALEIDPNLRDAYVLLASAYRKKGRERESAAALDEAGRVKDFK